MPWVSGDQWCNAEFDKERTKYLIQAAVFAVDDEVSKPPPWSNVPGPGGEPQHETGAEFIRRITGTAIMYLLEMGLLVIPDDAGERLDDYLPAQRMP
jgi:hypothetical protein